MTLVSEVREVVTCSRVEVAAGTAAHDCLAIASCRPGESECRGKVAELHNGRVQPVSTQNGNEESRFGEIVIERVWLVGPREAGVHRQPWPHPPGVACIQTVKIEDALRAKVAPRNHTGADVGSEALQGKLKNIVQSV